MLYRPVWLRITAAALSPLLLALCLAACGGAFSRDPSEKLSRAINNNSAAEIRELLAGGFPAEYRTSTGRTPLMLAATKDAVDIIQVLLEHKADINAREDKKQTALHLAARWSDPATIAFLLQNGADSEAKDYLSWTPLMWSCLQGRDAAVSALLDGGASLENTDGDGNTPLILSAWRGQENTARLLLERGADPAKANRHGLTAGDVAEKNGFPELAKMLRAGKAPAPEKN